MAVRAHEFAVSDFGLDAFEAVALPDEFAHLHPFRADVVELQNRWVG
jgi:hypothetical protein